MQMQTQTQMEMQASSHVQRKRKEREIRKRKKYFSKMADNDWAFADSHLWEANANTNFRKWKCFIIVIQRMFSSWVRQCTLQFVFGDCRSFYFHSLIESTFLVSKGLLCLYEKHNNTWLLVDMKFLVTCSTRHLTRSLPLLVSCRVKHSKRNSISKRTHVLSCVILFFYFLHWRLRLHLHLRSGRPLKVTLGI